MSLKRRVEDQVRDSATLPRWLQEIQAVVSERTCLIANTEVTYFVCAPWPEGMEPASYDESGNIYIAKSLVDRTPEVADLVAFHEQTEMDQKAAGRSHTYAHRRALLLQLVAAKTIFREPERLCEYIHWHIGMYPDWKLSNKEDLADQICGLLLAERPPRGKLLDLIKLARL